MKQSNRINARASIEFGYFSSSLNRFFPGWPLQKHYRYYRKALKTQDMQLSKSFEKRFLKEDFRPEGLFKRLTKPGIILSFHFGPYRLLPMWLMKAGIRFTMVVEQRIAARFGQEYERLYRRICGRDPKGHFELMIAEDRQCLRRMKARLAEGHFILIFADGYSGTQRHMKRAGILEAGGQHLFMRMGYLDFSNLFEVPIYPVMPSYKGQSLVPQLRSWPTLKRKRDEGKSDFVERALGRLSAYLWYVLKRYPAQWEALFYLHELQDPELTRPERTLSEFAPMYHKGKFYVLHKASFQVFQVRKEQGEELIYHLNSQL